MLKFTSIVGYTSCGPTYIESFLTIFGQCINVLNYKLCYNPPVNFRAILLVTSPHVVQITGRISRNNPHLRRYLSSDYFRQREAKPAGKRQLEKKRKKKQTQMLFRKVQKKSAKYAVNIF